MPARCGCEESMWHLVKCRRTMIFWNLVMDFLKTVLHVGQPRAQRVDLAVVFNICRRDPVPSRGKSVCVACV